MHHRVELVALLAEGLQTQLVERVQQLFGHRTERADQVTVLAGTIEVVQDRQQDRHHVHRRLVRDRLTVAIHAFAVVVVLGGHPL